MATWRPEISRPDKAIHFYMRITLNEPLKNCLHATGQSANPFSYNIRTLLTEPPETCHCVTKQSEHNLATYNFHVPLTDTH
jgi:hypothetical protein